MCELVRTAPGLESGLYKCGYSYDSFCSAEVAGKIERRISKSETKTNRGNRKEEGCDKNEHIFRDSTSLDIRER